MESIRDKENLLLLFNLLKMHHSLPQIYVLVTHNISKPHSLFLRQRLHK